MLCLAFLLSCLPVLTLPDQPALPSHTADKLAPAVRPATLGGGGGGKSSIIQTGVEGGGERTGPD